MWQDIKQAIRDEPVAFQWMLQTALVGGTAYGLRLTPDQLVATLTFTAAVLSFFTRRAVTPNGKVPT